jgi:hypothetical protein
MFGTEVEKCRDGVENEAGQIGKKEGPNQGFILKINVALFIFQIFTWRINVKSLG